MSTSKADNLEIADATLAWNRLAEQVDAFLAAWQAAHEPPALGEFLPEGPLALRRLILVELIKADLEHRWQGRRWPKQIEEYLAEYPELAEGGSIPCDLIYEEYHIRKQTGDVADPQGYFERFPKQATELGRLLGLEAPMLTTTLISGEQMQQIEVGQQIDDFDLLTRLGKGAFASVYLARQRSMQRLVALKVSGDRGTEPQTMAQLDHPHIVRVYDQRQLLDRKLRLLYMQYVPGGTLQSVIQHIGQVPAAVRNGKTFLAAVDEALVRQGESAPTGSGTRYKLEHATWPEVVCWLGARLASALAYAHQQGILHRDVKPANVLVAADGTPKLADFNISFSSKLEGATPAAYFGGSLAYMAPEQLEACDPAHPRQADSLDGRCDVYSLGVLLWELLTGSRPFVDEALPGAWSSTLAQMTARRREGVPEQARARLPRNCPAGLEQTLLKCLAPNPEDRFASAAEVARHLDLCLQPNAQRLLEVGTSAWRNAARRWPLLALVLAGVMPNAVMSGLNIAYNWFEIIRTLPGAAQEAFLRVLLLEVNGIAYPLGVVWVLYLIWPVLSSIRRLAMTGKAPPSLPVLRARCLKLGDYASWVSGGLWAFSGIVFPVLLQLHSGGDTGLQVTHYVHFIVSQVLCGLIAATLTFFFVTLLAVHVYYPWLVAPQIGDVSETSDLVALGRRTGPYFGLAVSVPFLAVMLMVLIDTGRIAIGVLGAVGFGGFLLSYRLLTAIRTDLGALMAIVNPGGDSLATGTETDSFWTGSRR